LVYINSIKITPKPHLPQTINPDFLGIGVY